MHPLLRRQLRKAFPGGAPDGGEITAFLDRVDAAYQAADDDRKQLMRSLHLVSDELYERNRRLEHELEERKRLEVELQHSEKLRAVGQLAAGVAHEINTPVQFIGDSLTFLAEAFAEIDPLLATECAAQNPEAPFLRVEIPRALRRCRDGADRVTRIVRALKVLAHPDGRDQELADLGAAIENTLIVVASELKYVADAQVDIAALRKVRCHIGEIQQVLLNLLVNAAHAITERYGSTGPRGTIRITAREDGDDAVIAVADDGCGIPEEARPRVFEPFFTTKPVGRGSGQGLSIAHSLIVERHGGHLSFETAVGAGTTFTIRIPIAGRPASREAAA